MVTGGTGSFGKKFVEIVLQQYPRIKRLVIFSRDEMKQFEMQYKFSPEKYKALRYFVGDVRDKARLIRAFEGIDYVIHAAALKIVPIAEYNPIEAISTNIIGAENVINAALEAGVKKIIALSTDKAVAPVNLYGATKLCADKLFVAINVIKGKRDIAFSVVRYGNVMGSRGSIAPYFLHQKNKGVLTVTDPEMTRFNISLEEGVKLVLHALKVSWGGEIFVPKLPSFRITDLAKAVCPTCKIKIIGIRPGEKIHEELVTESESFNTAEFKNYYATLPNPSTWNQKRYLKKYRGKKVPRGFKYTSGTNTQWLSVRDLKKLVQKLS